MTVVCPLIIIILISYIIIYIKLLIMENHPRGNQKRNSISFVDKSEEQIDPNHRHVRKMSMIQIPKTSYILGYGLPFHGPML